MHTLNTTFTKSSLVVAIVFALYFSLNMLSSSALQAQDKTSNVATFPMYPLIKGLKWRYEREGRGRWDNYEVVGIRTIDNKECFEIINQHWDLNKERKKYLEATTNYFVFVKDDGVYLLETRRGTDRYQYSPPKCFLKAASNNPQEWEQNLNEIRGTIGRETGSMKCNYSFHQYQETIRLKGKEVDATTVIETTSFPFNGYKTQIWYVHGIGSVKKGYGDLDGKIVMFDVLVEQTGPKIVFNPTNPIKTGDVAPNKNEVKANGDVVKHPMATQPVAKPVEKSGDGLSWEAIGAIAGIVSVIIALIAIMRKKEV